MSGFTTRAFREIAYSYGASLVYTEMVSAIGLSRGDKNTIRMISFNSNVPTGIQLFGSEPDDFIGAIKQLKRLGIKPALMDINAGCPVRKVVKKGAGAALMREPKRLKAIVSAVKEYASVPVTVKIRSGWNERNINAVECAKMIEKGGADAICVHGRTKTQGYGGEVDLEIIRKVKEEVNIPVIGSGDNFTPEDVVKMFGITNVDGVMIARGAIGRPWIFKQIREFMIYGSYSPVAMKEKYEVIRKELKGWCEDLGEDRGVREFRKSLVRYVKGMPNACKFRDSVFKVKDKAQLIKLINDYFRSLRDDLR